MENLHRGLGRYQRGVLRTRWFKSAQVASYYYDNLGRRYSYVKDQLSLCTCPFLHSLVTKQMYSTTSKESRRGEQLTNHDPAAPYNLYNPISPSLMQKRNPMRRFRSQPTQLPKITHLLPPSTYMSQKLLKRAARSRTRV